MNKSIGLKIFVKPSELQQLNEMDNVVNYSPKQLQLIGMLVERIRFASAIAQQSQPRRPRKQLGIR